MAPARAGRSRLVILVTLLACICCSEWSAAASDSNTEVALDHDTDMEAVEASDCDTVVDTFLAKRSKMPKLMPDSHNHMLYFLHIPRTAGRTYHACFLKCGHPTALTTSTTTNGCAVSQIRCVSHTRVCSVESLTIAPPSPCRLSHPPSKRCAKSYDVLRLDLSVPACGLLSSHDDFSVVDNLPDDAAVITQVCLHCQHGANIIMLYSIATPITHVQSVYSKHSFCPETLC